MTFCRKLTEKKEHPSTRPTMWAVIFLFHAHCVANFVVGKDAEPQTPLGWSSFLEMSKDLGNYYGLDLGEIDSSPPLWATEALVHMGYHDLSLPKGIVSMSENPEIAIAQMGVLTSLVMISTTAQATPNATLQSSETSLSTIQPSSTPPEIRSQSGDSRDRHSLHQSSGDGMADSSGPTSLAEALLDDDIDAGSLTKGFSEYIHQMYGASEDEQMNSVIVRLWDGTCNTNGSRTVEFAYNARNDTLNCKFKRYLVVFDYMSWVMKWSALHGDGINIQEDSLFQFELETLEGAIRTPLKEGMKIVILANSVLEEDGSWKTKALDVKAALIVRVNCFNESETRLAQWNQRIDRVRFTDKVQVGFEPWSGPPRRPVLDPSDPIGIGRSTSVLNFFGVGTGSCSNDTRTINVWYSEMSGWVLNYVHKIACFGEFEWDEFWKGMMENKNAPHPKSSDDSRVYVSDPFVGPEKRWSPHPLSEGQYTCVLLRHRPFAKQVIPSDVRDKAEFEITCEERGDTSMKSFADLLGYLAVELTSDMYDPHVASRIASDALDLVTESPSGPQLYFKSVLKKIKKLDSSKSDSRTALRKAVLSVQRHVCCTAPSQTIVVDQPCDNATVAVITRLGNGQVTTETTRVSNDAASELREGNFTESRGTTRSSRYADQLFRKGVRALYSRGNYENRNNNVASEHFEEHTVSRSRKGGTRSVVVSTKHFKSATQHESNTLRIPSPELEATEREFHQLEVKRSGGQSGFLPNVTPEAEKSERI